MTETAIPLTKAGTPDKRYAPSEADIRAVSKVRARERQARTGVEIPSPEKGRHYTWKAVDSGHAQSFSIGYQDGWQLVPGRKAVSLGLYGYVNNDTQEEVVVDVGGGILFGNTVLMDCSDDVWYGLCDLKFERFKGVEDEL